MDYKRITEEIEQEIEEARNVKYQFPLLADLILRRKMAKREYYARITYNLFLHGSSPMKFDDIDYPN